MGFDPTTPLDVTRLDWRRWQLQTPLRYEGRTDTFTVPAGFVTDFATVPWWSRLLTPATGKWTRAAVVHDLLCDGLNDWHAAHMHDAQGSRDLCRLLVAKQGGLYHPDGRLIKPPLACSRDTDNIFRKIMHEEDVDPLRRWMMWTGVRWGALANPARREGWWRDAPKILAITILLLVALFIVVGTVHDLADVFLEGDPLWWQ